MSSDGQASWGQMPYEPGYCTCAHLVTFHAFNTKKQRAKCSWYDCTCRLFVAAPEVAEPQAVKCVHCSGRPAAGLCCSSHKAALCHGCYRRSHFVEICDPACEDCVREGIDPTMAVKR